MGGGGGDGGGVGIKAACLILLTAITTFSPLVTRYVRIRNDQELFIVSVMVVSTETVKALICFTVVLFMENSARKCLSSIYSNIIEQPMTTLKACVPAACYSLQNFLYMIALSNLDPVIFCVTYQLKILTTAFFAVVLLKKELRRLQYVSLVLLVVGVGLVEVESHNGSKSGGGDGDLSTSAGNTFLGMTSVLTMCFSSGFAGVYMEKMFKESTASVYVENLRLQVFQLPIVTVTMLVKDWNQIQTDGMFVGFDWIVWTLVLLGGISGLIIAMTMKYAGNIPKTYAQCLAIIFTAVGSVIWFNLRPSSLFVLGCVVVAVAIGLYNKRPSDSEKEVLPSSVKHIDLRAYTYQDLLLAKNGGRNAASG